MGRASKTRSRQSSRRTIGSPGENGCAGTTIGHPPSVLTRVGERAYRPRSGSNTRSKGRDPRVTKRFDEEILVERDAGMPSGFEWRGGGGRGVRGGGGGGGGG